MAAVRRILVPVDFSPSSRAALEFAGYLADRTGASVDVLHVWEPPAYVGADSLGMFPAAPAQPLWDRTRGEVMREMEHFLGRRDPKAPAISARVEAGEPSDTILHVAKESGADLIVMGTHGRTGLSRLLIGSVAEAVLRRSSCPVLTIRVPSRHVAKEGVPM